MYMKNILSIDTESWIHFYEDALKIKKISSEKRKEIDNGYIKEAISNILDILDKYNQKATFFVVAEIHNWYPKIIEKIKKRGHEIGYHTHTHPILKEAAILEEELLLSKKFIKKFKPIGFRAPQIYLTEDAMPILEKKGFKYSSSSYDKYVISKYNNILEIPVSVISIKSQLFKKNLPKQLTFKLLFSKIPFGSGLFISLLGQKISRFIRKLNKKGIPAILFIHPWQLYQTREINSLKFRLNIILKNPLCLPYTKNIYKSMEKLLKEHKFTSFQDYYGQQRILG